MDKNIEILKKQEDLLQFPHFNHSTAYEFGTFMVSCAQNQNITIAISIRMNNGCIAYVLLYHFRGNLFVGFHDIE